jgi:hypothetical protein
MKRLLVDYSLIGHGDGVPPRIAEVTAVSSDEKIFEFTFADPRQ